MYQRLTSLLLRLLKVPHEPQPPHGDPASLRVFRAGRNLFKLRLFGWGLGQLLAFAGIVFWLGVFLDVENTVDELKASQTRTAPARSSPDTVAPAKPTTGTPRANRGKRNSYADFKTNTARQLARLPGWTFHVLWALKIVGILAYFAQLPVTYLIARLDYELRWYMVTDRSLRIRQGVWKVAESTMSFANIQQVVVSQGPIQRLLGLADVKVQSAGGGSGHEHKPGHDDMHMGLFHSVTNAPEIRDLILERLRRFRESGLGDPDEKSHQPQYTPSTTTAIASSELIAAAQALAAEARALRTSLG